ncbi:cytochrome P450 [Nocardia transvalensis]|uniref:cytochrome P450 n=1 Tax=Nocardia transvalensis TaxID=37333 RepID=UPI002B4B85D3|nr:cytochrome P450 [Nocardia transvalensis]
MRILNDPGHFPADPRDWQTTVPQDSPILPMLEWRPNALWNAGPLHYRYRSPSVEAIDGVDLFAMHNVVERIAIPLINTFCEHGKADLLRQYIRPLMGHTLDHMLGCTAEIGQRIATGSAMMVDAQGDAEAGNSIVVHALLEHIASKRAEAGNDITSRMLAHPVGLDDEEMVHQLMTVYGAGVELCVNLIGNTLRSMLVNDGYADDLRSGSLSTRDALDTVLAIDPPMANHCITYPRQPVFLEDDGVWLPAHQPVVISMAAAGNDPAVTADDRTGNRSHLAWGAGPHACPARYPAYSIAVDAIDQLLDVLPEIELACRPDELVWRPGPFHRALVELPVVFLPSPPLPDRGYRGSGLA